MSCPDSVYNLSDNADVKDVVAAVKCLKDEISKLDTEFERLGKSSRDFASNFGGGIGKVGNRIKSMYKDMAEFSKSTERQYQLAEELAQSYKKTAINLGLSVGRSKEFSLVFKRSAAAIAEFGGNASDVADIMENFQRDSGRTRILNPEDVENIFLLKESTGLMGNEVESLYENFDLMGKSLSDVNKEMEILIADSQRVGLNSSKVIDVLSSSMKQMQTFSFANGVKGMTEMAKQAVRMRMDVSDVLSMAEKFYQPEAAIEAAAELQLLGGDIAAAFGDPFTIMYEARNKPEELAKRVQKMTENMIQFNEESGEYELPAEARMQFDALSKSIGMSSSQLIEMSRQTAKMKDVKMQLSGSAFSDEELEGIANMAKVKDGEFKVDIYDPKTGERLEKSLDELGKGDVEMLLKPPPTQEELMKKEDKYMDDMVKNSMTTNQILTSINEQFNTAFVAENDVYQLMEGITKESIENVRDFGQEFGTIVQKKFDESFLRSGTDIFSESMQSVLNTYTEKIGQGFLSLFEGKSSKTLKGLSSEQLGDMFRDIKDFKLNMAGGVINITNENTSGGDSQNTSQKVGDFLSRNDGTVTSFSSMDDIIGAKSGGPIDKLLNSVLPNKQTSVVEVKGNPKIDININSNNPNMNFTSEQMEQITNVAMKSILSIFNNGGSIDGGNQSQNSKGFEQNLGTYG